eukprot:TRINITY_DN11272_c0_g1_i1.p1 TRINITY_DN11272_c0_g1~~TRINITY_DN11272_c0_g1_i1.p1  ORF type:complete len:404 (+),score=88.77 TRINITY_DN11272_c0_g1_i1:38-1213(+)
MSKAGAKFWPNQPVPQSETEQVDGDIGPIHEEKDPVADVRQTPYPLPAAFEWYNVDVNDPEELNKVYELLRDHYVEDDDNMFRFDYSPEFLQWALKPPGWVREWHLAVRMKKTGDLYGFITAIPALITIGEENINMVEINFLCVHKMLRTKRLAPVLISEITRRVNVTDRWQAVFTAGITLPTPVASCRYYHRSLNPKKLIEVKFSALRRRMTMARTIKLYRVPEETQVPGMRPFRPSDLEDTRELLVNYLQKFNLYMNFDDEEFLHWFTPVEDVIYTYVVEDPETGRITDFLSFYTLPSTIIGNDKYNTLKAAYSFYNVATSVPLTKLMGDALTLAKQNDFDVFNALDIHDNKDFFEELKFGPGDGYLQYYLYNYRYPPIESADVGLVLL